MRRLFLTIAALMVATQACAAETPVATRGFDVAGFRRIDLRGSDHVVVRVGPAFSVTATGPSAVLATLTAMLRGDTLRIGHAQSKGLGWNRRPGGVATVVVTLPALVGASVSGSGDMRIAPFRTARFAGIVAGSGDLTLARLDAEQADLSVAGSGDLNAAGRATRASLSIAGSGDLDAGTLAIVTLGASGAVHCNAA